MIEIVPNWHPLFVHFTVALLSIAALLKLAAWFVSSETLRTQWQIVARWNLWLGAGFTVLTVATGWLAYNSVTHDTPSHAAMTDHRNWAMVTAPLFVLIAVWSMFRARAGKESSALLLVALLVATGLLGSTAWRGGEIVYRYGLGVMSLPRSDSHGHAPGVEDDHGDMSSSMTSGDSHADVDDGHHDEAVEIMEGNDSETHGHDSGEPLESEGEVHTHADGTTERH